MHNHKPNKNIKFHFSTYVLIVLVHQPHRFYLRRISKINKVCYVMILRIQIRLDVIRIGTININIIISVVCNTQSSFIFFLLFFFLPRSYIIFQKPRSAPKKNLYFNYTRDESLLNCEK